MNGTGLSDVACVTVTYNPEPDALATQFAALSGCGRLIVVDNASRPELLHAVAALVSRTPNATLMRNASNLGLAAAVNRGARAAAQQSPRMHYLLLLDQDTEPSPGSLLALRKAFEQLNARDNRVAAVGPNLTDVTTGLRHGFHQAAGWRWRRVYRSTAETQPVACSNLNGSGTLASLDLFLDCGGLDEALFIDHVDTEWSFRMLAAGYWLWGIPRAEFRHRMGRRGLRFWCFGWRVWPVRSPLRHRYLFRNALWLMRRSYVPRVWKFWAAVKLLITLAVHALFDPERVAQVRSMLAGMRDGCTPPPPA